ncbi:ModE family transcriptional regulator [Citrobacter sp. NCU1]|uniref:winged helix-turn-helix domain-containing protein n=1 Tax=Citrobacter sp. NCU1 TaxID=2026683 RepID=UPI00139076BE|nr:winged helix-turn-helix domain-containing protein [Citrobacter sp. NCU1]NDO81680.1 ModE family transcriptional regulator [Citrobacter sp. NCU1]
MNSIIEKPNCLLVRPRIYVNDNISIGPGKIDLLRAIDGFHSLSAAAKDVGVPYKRAWLLIDSLNKGIGKPVVITSTGGNKGGGTILTPLGRKLLENYDKLEAHLNEQSQQGLQELESIIFEGNHSV